MAGMDWKQNVLINFCSTIKYTLCIQNPIAPISYAEINDELYINPEPPRRAAFEKPAWEYMVKVTAIYQYFDTSHFSLVLVCARSNLWYILCLLTRWWLAVGHSYCLSARCAVHLMAIYWTIECSLNFPFSFRQALVLIFVTFILYVSFKAVNAM